MGRFTGRQGVHWAAYGGHVSVLARLKEHDCDLNVSAADGSTPLHLAADNGNLDAVQWLLRHGADAHMKNRGGQTAKDLAKDSGHKKVAEHLHRKSNEVGESDTAKEESYLWFWLLSSIPTRVYKIKFLTGAISTSCCVWDDKRPE